MHAPLPTPGPPARARLLLLCAGALLPAALAVAQLGRVHPDEVYQFLEPAWHRAHGYGVLAWEWREGLRNWALPLLASWLLRLAALLGLDHPLAYRALLALPQAALHGAVLAAAYRSSLRRTGSGAAALLATALLALYGPVLVFAGRTLGESFSAAFLVLAVCALDGAPREGNAQELRHGLWGGLWLGLSVVARYGSAVFVLAALAWLAAARRLRALGGVLLAGGAVAAGLAALDAWSWGAPLHSLLAYLRFNVLSDGAVRQFGAQPPGFYLAPLALALPLWGLLALPAATRSLRARHLALAPVMALAYLAAVAATPHKEDRFLYPALVLLALAAAPAAASALRSLGSARARTGGALAALLLGLLPLWGYPALDLRGDQLRAIVRASRGGATGLLIVNEGLWGAGGFFYLGRPIPWTTCDWPRDAAFQGALADPRFNRAVTFEGRALAELQAGGFRVVGQEGRETLLAR
ncbi:mannosyltransferase [Aggregicoccus sp. 17bor-14]|uniref:mannosyltransferase n=1 Tax=Myxococcaceae TaxID=31 RepID=UPI00129CCC2B|nr:MULTISPECIES: mannosyltransferase [Myxococcaceae]MBF5042856.1 mannosyltransferase [Simulacricoccus sp. 17bor-14]MRI88623.1 mannosyltransferase [Aggregicoccus sp. 17bor-14]